MFSCSALIMLPFASWQQVGWCMELLGMLCREARKLTKSPLQRECDPPSHCPTIVDLQEKKFPGSVSAGCPWILYLCDASMNLFNRKTEWAPYAMAVALGGTWGERMAECLCMDCPSLPQQSIQLSTELCVCILPQHHSHDLRRQKIAQCCLSLEDSRNNGCLLKYLTPHLMGE